MKVFANVVVRLALQIVCVDTCLFVQDGKLAIRRTNQLHLDIGFLIKCTLNAPVSMTLAMSKLGI